MAVLTKIIWISQVVTQLLTVVSDDLLYGVVLDRTKAQTIFYYTFFIFFVKQN